MKYIVEVLAGSVADCVVAQEQGGHRIELNNGVHLGGLTPSIATLIEAKKRVQIPIVTMVRPRAGGFHYNELEVITMFEDAKHLIKHGADGLVFGFLKADGSVDKDLTKRFVDMAHEHKVEAIFHRAYDRTNDPIQAIKDLIECGVDRVLTSGLEPTADKGIPLLKTLKEDFGTQIEFCVGSGVNAGNVKDIIEQTGMTQVHASFKGWFEDPTTSSDKVSYGYSDQGDYDGVDANKLSTFLELLEKL